MFEFFIALIGGGYYFSKYKIEQAKINDAKSELNYKHSLLANFNKIHAAGKYEWDEFVRDMQYGYITPQEVYDVIGDDLKEVYGDDYELKCPLPGMSLYNSYKKMSGRMSQPDAYDPVCWAAHLWLSKQGKIRYQDCLSAIPLGIHPKETIELCKIIERNVRKMGNNITFVAVPGCHKTSLLPDYSESNIMVLECIDLLPPYTRVYKRIW